MRYTEILMMWLTNGTNCLLGYIAAGLVQTQWHFKET